MDTISVVCAVIGFAIGFIIGLTADGKNHNVSAKSKRNDFLVAIACGIAGAIIGFIAFWVIVIAVVGYLIVVAVFGNFS